MTILHKSLVGLERTYSVNIQSVNMVEAQHLRGRHVVVVVCGPFDRSPRMQYHALSLLGEEAQLTVVGYAGDELTPGLESQRSKIRLRLFTPIEWPYLKRLCWPLFAALKVLALVFQLTWALLTIPSPDIILVQNPPALPALPVACFVGLLRDTPVLIDWHNLGFTVLSLALGARTAGPLKYAVTACRAVEGWCARRAAGHFCVTQVHK